MHRILKLSQASNKLMNKYMELDIEIQQVNDAAVILRAAESSGLTVEEIELLLRGNVVWKLREYGILLDSVTGMRKIAKLVNYLTPEINCKRGK